MPTHSALETASAAVDRARAEYAEAAAHLARILHLSQRAARQAGPTEAVERARVEYAEAAAHLARVLSQPPPEVESKPGGVTESVDAIAERMLGTARRRYGHALERLAEAREPAAWNPGDRTACRHVLERIRPGVYECRNCGRIGDWVDGLIVWRKEAAA
jgi:multidrug resistance efflux pump